jgi:succinyl-diaminopimelate desuccinylase
VEDILRKHGVRYSLEWFLSGEPFYTPPGPLSDAVSAAVQAITASWNSVSRASRGWRSQRCVQRLPGAVIGAPDALLVPQCR